MVFEVHQVLSDADLILNKLTTKGKPNSLHNHTLMVHKPHFSLLIVHSFSQLVFSPVTSQNYFLDCQESMSKFSPQ